MTAREQAAVQEVQRLTERLTAAEAEIARVRTHRSLWASKALEWAALADSLAENVQALLAGLTDAGVLVHGGRVGPEDGMEEWYWWASGVQGDEDVREAVGYGIRGCNVALDAYNEQREAES